MEIIDLAQEHHKLFFQCLEDWSADIKEAGDHKEQWFSQMKDQGLRVKLAVDDRGEVGGMVQYVPVRHSSAEGRDLYFINCIWVHGHKQGRGNFQKKGMGRALLAAAEQDAKALGAKGMAAWGLILPVWMKASWFKRQGYQKVDRMSIQSLLWKPFASDARAPKWVREKKRPKKTPGVVTVTSFINGWCPAQNLVHERAKRAAGVLGEKVVFNEFKTFDRAVFLEWGISDALFIDDKQVRTGPPPAYEKIKKMIEKRVKKL
jgi:N-acetylglutamate synthase-like GNAT family acetyltransferase